MKTATERLKEIVNADIEKDARSLTNRSGYDWFQLSPEEAFVFMLQVDDLISLVPVWCAYENVLSICDYGMEIPEDIIQGFLEENPWIKQSRETHTHSEPEFIKFSAMFGVDINKASAWFHKADFWYLRDAASGL